MGYGIVEAYEEIQQLKGVINIVVETMVDNPEFKKKLEAKGLKLK